MFKFRHNKLLYIANSVPLQNEFQNNFISFIFPIKLLLNVHSYFGHYTHHTHTRHFKGFHNTRSREFRNLSFFKLTYKKLILKITYNILQFRNII